MDFRGEEKPPPYFNRRDQIRLLLLTLALALVLLAIPRVADPKFFGWMFPAQGDAAPADENDPAFLGTRDDGIESTADPEDFLRDPPREWLKGVKDEKTGILSTEHDAYYGLLSWAKAADLDAFEAAAAERPSRSVLMTSPAYYRGKIVTVEGELVRLQPLPVLEPFRSRYGIDTLWDAWIVTPDAPTNPVHCLLTTVRKSFPVGREIAARPKVRVTGFFLKHEGFVVDGGINRTPLILGKTAVPLVVKQAYGDANELVPYIRGFAITIAVVIGALLLWFRASDRKFGKTHVRHFTEAPEGAIDELAGLETVDPAEAMRRLAAEEESEEEERAADVATNEG